MRAVRVTVLGTRRADLVVPGGVPVAELLPDLTRETDAPAGCRVMLTGGRVLAPDLGVADQGIVDGTILSLVAGPDPPVVYDDVVEALADAVERDTAPWRPGRGAALVAGLLLLVVGGVALTGASARVLAGALTGATLAQGLLPRVALGLAGTGRHRWDAEVDGDRVAAEARSARDLLVAGHAVTGALLVALAPCAVTLGRYGALLALAACVTTALRTRRQRSGAEVLVRLASAGLGLLTAAAALVVRQPHWLPPAGLGAVAAGGVLLLVRPTGSAWWWGRAADAVELLALVSLAPIYAVSAGLVPGVAP